MARGLARAPGNRKAVGQRVRAPREPDDARRAAIGAASEAGIAPRFANFTLIINALAKGAEL